MKKYKRVILKFSGEMLRGKEENGDTISFEVLRELCRELKFVHDSGIELGVVIGGGNIFRGLTANQKFGYSRVVGDYAGMLATAINSIIIADHLQEIGVDVVVFSAIPMPNVCEPYYPRHAQKSIKEGKILLLAGGTGNAFFSTDSAAALRANELGADVVIKCTKVDGVYDKDPKKYKDAKKFDEISFQEVLLNRLNVMDSTAFSLCMDNNIPIIVIDAENDLKNISRAINGEHVGTMIANF